MYKVRVFCIMLFIFSILVLQPGCAKKIETAKSSAGIEGNRASGPDAKQEKAIEAAGGRENKEVERKPIGEENAGKAATSTDTEEAKKDSEPGETALQGKSELKASSISPDTNRENPVTADERPKNGEVALKPPDAVTGGERGADVGRHELKQGEIPSEIIGREKEVLLVPDKEIQVAREDTGSAPAALIKKSEDPGLKDVFFDFDSWVVKGDFMKILEQDAKYLTSKPKLKIQIEGHADERGTNEYNLTLGERRAKSTMNFLMDMGVSKERISIISYGEEKPFCTEHAESCWSINRRGHFMVIDH